jgi:hypothetical protein
MKKIVALFLAVISLGFTPVPDYNNPNANYLMNGEGLAPLAGAWDTPEYDFGSPHWGLPFGEFGTNNIFSSNGFLPAVGGDYTEKAPNSALAVGPRSASGASMGQPIYTEVAKYLRGKTVTFSGYYHACHTSAPTGGTKWSACIGYTTATKDQNFKSTNYSAGGETCVDVAIANMVSGNAWKKFTVTRAIPINATNIQVRTGFDASVTYAGSAIAQCTTAVGPANRLVLLSKLRLNIGSTSKPYLPFGGSEEYDVLASSSYGSSAALLMRGIAVCGSAGNTIFATLPSIPFWLYRPEYCANTPTFAAVSGLGTVTALRVLPSYSTTTTTLSNAYLNSPYTTTAIANTTCTANAVTEAYISATLLCER